MAIERQSMPYDITPEPETSVSADLFSANETQHDLMASASMPKTIPVISIFCGPGGMDIGFREQGFTPVLALDIDQSAVETYNANNEGKVAQQADLLTLSDSDLANLVREASPHASPRGIIGGPPCQSFSVSNVHHKPNDVRRRLLVRYAQILKALNKAFNLDFFVFENVSGLKSRKHKRYFRRVLRALEDAGFTIFQEELDASNFGVPQHRRRLFVVGVNRLLYPNVGFLFPDGNTETPATVRDTIGGLPEPAYFRRDIKREEIPHHPNHWTMNPRSPKFTNDTNGKGRSFRRLDWDQPSWTVAYGHREMHIHPNGVRRVSIFEAMLFQSFPRHYELKGNLSQQVQQISNAVPPPLASAIAKAVRSSIYNPIADLQDKVLAWFERHHRSFPWRGTRSPYRILVAEKLLQQTAATERVVVAYQEIIEHHPTVESMAQARLGEMRQLIRPLGFLYRAGELRELARAILNDHGGTVPSNLPDLVALPGVGDYSARAVLSFACGQDVPVVDTNVARFLYRIYGIQDRIPSNPARSRRLIQMADALIPQGKSRAFNFAILDLCSSVCKPHRPNCFECPIQSHCAHGAKAANGVGL
jgi:DNA (cytosine-5)-methyltransferase 1